MLLAPRTLHRGSPVVSRSPIRAAVLVCALSSGACDDDSAPTLVEAAPSSATVQHPDDAAAPTPAVVEANDYCDHVCGRAKDCDESFDRQTCMRECKSESGVISNLNPDLIAGLYECIDNTSCSTIGAERFVATCLADAAASIEPTSAGKAFCKELEKGADECSFTDYEERACWQVSIAFADAVLDSASICARKECDLIIECLDATMKVPSEPDGSPVGFDSGELSSGNAAYPASVSLFPKTTASLSPAVSTGSSLSSGPVPSATPSNASSLPADVTNQISAPPLPSAPAGLDIEDPDVQAQYCADAEPCTDCRLSACCIETLTCLTNDSCIEWITCITDCAPEDGACEDSCRSTYASGEDAAFAYIGCFTGATDGVCASICQALDAGPADAATPQQGDTNVGSETSLDTASTGVDAVSSHPAETDSNAVGDGGSPTCADCLNVACDPEIKVCFADDPCFYLYVQYAYCADEGNSSGEFATCFGPYYDSYAEYEPDSVSLFESMLGCFDTADCPICD